MSIALQAGQAISYLISKFSSVAHTLTNYPEKDLACLHSPIWLNFSGGDLRFTIVCTRE